MKPLLPAWALALALAVSPARAASLDYARPRLLDLGGLAYPEKAKAHGFYSGEVRLMVEIDGAGRVVDALPVAATDGAFVEEVQRRLADFRFEPARLTGDGRPVPVRTLLELNFRASGVVVTQTAEENTQARIVDISGPPTLPRVCSPGELDRALRPRRTVAPAAAPAGSVTVDFYIDESGRVRLPAVESSSDPAQAEAALAALAQWEFEPPTRGGRPVLVHALQAFRFRPPAG